jgi:protein gp37
MSESTEIEWTDATWSVTKGCTILSEGCRSCYAMKFAHRFSGPGGRYEGLTVLGNHGPRWNGKVELLHGNLDKPLYWKKPRKIFVNSMSDLFHEKIPNEYIAAVFGVMAAAPQHTFQVLTKRAARMREWFEWLPSHYSGPRTVPPWATAELHSLLAAAPEAEWPLPNVHLGVSAENQETADERIPLLLQCPAAVRWVSAEPLLEHIDLNRAAWGEGKPHQALEIQARMVTPNADEAWRLGFTPLRALDWIVAGGESGPGARTCDVDWIRLIVEQCKAAGTPCFVKQLGTRPLARTRWDMSDEQFRVNDAAGWTEHDGPILLHLSKRKGGDINEFPDDLKVRQFPVSKLAREGGP